MEREKKKVKLYFDLYFQKNRKIVLPFHVNMMLFFSVFGKCFFPFNVHFQKWLVNNVRITQRGIMYSSYIIATYSYIFQAIFIYVLCIRNVTRWRQVSVENEYRFTHCLIYSRFIARVRMHFKDSQEMNPP